MRAVSSVLARADNAASSLNDTRWASPDTTVFKPVLYVWLWNTASVVEDPLTAGTIHAIFNQGTQDEFQSNEQADGTTTWSSPETSRYDYSGETTGESGGPSCHEATTVAGRSDVVPILFGGVTGQTWYHELDFSAAADPATEIPHPQYPAMAARDLRVDLAGMTPPCHQGDEEVV